MRGILYFAIFAQFISQNIYSANLVQRSDLQYLGAFRGPDCANDQNCLNSSGGMAMAFRSASAGQPKGSLFISCPQADGTVAEISIPNLVDASTTNNAATLNRASFIQNCTDPRKGASYSVNAGAAATPVGGLAIQGDKLVISYFGMYDPDYSQQASHYVKSSLNLTNSDAVGPYAISQAPVVTNGKVGYTSGPMALIPQEWQSLFGNNSLIAYNCCLSISSRTSYGPAAFAFSLNNMGTVSPNSTTYPATAAKSVPLLYYDETHQTIGGANSVYNGTTTFFNATVVPSARGLVIPNGTRSALFFQGQGMGTSAPVYGGTDCQNQHGYTNSPYHMIILAYDLDKWAASATNPAANPPYNNVPYAAWDLQNPISYPLFGNSKDCQGNGGGVVYDPDNKIIYWSQIKADPTSPYNGGLIIHAWKINTTGTSGGNITPVLKPLPPKNLKIL